MEENIIIIEADGSPYVCDDLKTAATLTGNSEEFIQHCIETGQSDYKGRTFDVVVSD